MIIELIIIMEIRVLNLSKIKFKTIDNISILYILI